jgi:hypothetical protein
MAGSTLVFRAVFALIGEKAPGLENGAMKDASFKGLRSRLMTCSWPIGIFTSCFMG